MSRLTRRRAMAGSAAASLLASTVLSSIGSDLPGHRDFHRTGRTRTVISDATQRVGEHGHAKTGWRSRRRDPQQRRRGARAVPPERPAIRRSRRRPVQNSLSTPLRLKVSPMSFDALVDSKIKTVVCRHEQNAAFIAGGIGRMTSKAGVAMATSATVGSCNEIVGSSASLWHPSNIVEHRIVAMNGSIDTSITNAPQTVPVARRRATVDDGQPHAAEAPPPPRVVIVGASIGGLPAAQALKRAPVEVTLI